SQGVLACHEISWECRGVLGLLCGGRFRRPWGGTTTARGSRPFRTGGRRLYLIRMSLFVSTPAIVVLSPSCCNHAICWGFCALKAEPSRGESGPPGVRQAGAVVDKIM